MKPLLLLRTLLDLRTLGALALAPALALSTACDDGGGGFDVCADTRCITAPQPICEGSTKVVYSAVGQCSEDPTGVAICTYAEAQRQDCSQLAGKECRQGQCLDKPVIPCANVTCNTPPAPDCAANISQIYESAGVCNPAILPAGKCEYDVIDSQDCTPLDRVCRAGACIDPTTTPCEPNPCDVAQSGFCLGNIPQVPNATGTCTQVTSEGQPAAACAYPAVAAPACTGATPECYKGACATGKRAPAALGELIINEVLKNPSAEGDEGEWFELYNTTTAALELDGCILSDAGNEDHEIGEVDLIVPAKGYIVLGRSIDSKINGGLTPEYMYSEFTLGNTADEIILTCGGVEIDRVAWVEGWPSGIGLAMSLSAAVLGAPATPATGAAIAAANDAQSAWCNALTAYGDATNEGSPRRVNPACP